MSRLAKRLRRSQLGMSNNRFAPPPEPIAPPPTDMTAEQQSEYARIYDDYNQSLSDEYDRNQEKAKQYEKQRKAIEKNNPHLLEAEMRQDPTPKGLYEMTIFGRPVDLAKLENYVLNTISPKSIVTKMRYDNSVAMEEVKGYAKKRGKPLPWTMIFIVGGIVGTFAIGVLYFMSGGDLSGMMEGLFGGQ